MCVERFVLIICWLWRICNFVDKEQTPLQEALSQLIRQLQRYVQDSIVYLRAFFLLSLVQSKT